MKLAMFIGTGIIKINGLLAGLISYYKFDNDVLDSHGSNDGTLFGPTYTASGKINGAYDFDGSNDYISIPYNLSYSDTTIATWVSIADNTSTFTILSGRHTGSGNAIWLFRVVNGQLNGFFRSSAGTGLISITGGTVPVSTMTHIAMTMSSITGEIILYINNSQVATGTYTGGTITCDKTRIGNDYRDNLPYDGINDETGIWGKILNTDERTALYNNGGGLSYNNFTFPEINGLLNNLISYYKFDNDVLDSHGSNDGTLNGATYTASGKINGAYDFDGSNDYIDLGDHTDFEVSGGSTTLSIFCWIKLTTNNESILSKYINSGTANSEYFLSSNNGKLYMSGNGTNTALGSSILITAGNYHYVGFTLNGSTVKGYVDGVETFSTSLNINGSGGNQSLKIGALSPSISPTWSDGIIDEVGIWDKILTIDEIANLYNIGTGLSYSKFTV